MTALSKFVRGAALLSALAAVPAAAQQRRIEYEVAFPNAIQHEGRVTATFSGLPAGQPLEVRMSRSSPGRYALHEFAKNVYSVSATDGRGRPLTVSRPDPYGWTVAGHDGIVRFSYTLFGDRTDGTYTGIDASHAHLNMPATFAWARGMERAPIRVTFRAPDPTWSIATQLFPTPDSATFTAPNLQYFMDSPTEVGPVQWRQWRLRAARGDSVTVRLALHHLGSAAETDAFAADARRVTQEQAALFGGLPSDRGVYTFIIDYLPWASGDGMEHRNSTIITSPRPLATSARQNLGTVSHEFFHQWNVERIRPKSLEPFDFERANMSGELWFAEGFTSYYDALFLRRAGLRTDAEYAENIGRNVNTVVNAPGRAFSSPVEMSQQAPFVDAATSIDPQNKANTFISYYTYGAALGLALDLSLRQCFPGTTLDDFYRLLWRDFGRVQDTTALAPLRPYTLADLRRALGTLTRDTAFANDFFRRYVEGREAPDYKALLAPAGFLVRKAAPGAPWIGVALQADDSVVAVAGPTLIGSPLYRTGLGVGDQVLALDGQPVRTPEQVRALAAARALGTPMPITYTQRGQRREGTITWTEDPALEVVPYEAAGLPVTDAVRAFRAAWLGSKVARGE